MLLACEDRWLMPCGEKWLTIKRALFERWLPFSIVLGAPDEPTRIPLWKSPPCPFWTGNPSDAIQCQRADGAQMSRSGVPIGGDQHLVNDVEIITEK